jgi:hypothetical protein
MRSTQTRRGLEAVRSLELAFCLTRRNARAMRIETGDASDVGLTEKRWTRYGHDRVYLSNAEDAQVGHIDLKAQRVVVEDPAFDAACQVAFMKWCPPSVEVSPTQLTQLTHAAPPQTPPPPKLQPTAAATASTRDASALPSLIKAKRDSTCTVCGDLVLKGRDLFRVVGTNVAVCPPCTAGEVAAALDVGTPGGAAARMADGAARHHAEKILAAYPMLGQHLIANARPTANMNAWMRGADGERIVGRKLDIAAADGRIVVLHDRRMPAGGNIDHLVIGPRRICVVDAKNYKNARVTRDNDILMVAGKTAEHLIDGVRHQRAAVMTALADRPRIADNVFGVLAFVSGKLGFLGIIRHRGVWCSAEKDALNFAATKVLIGSNTMKLDDEQRREVAEILARAFPPC